MKDDDVCDLIVNALTGVCQMCKGRGWYRQPPEVYTCFGTTTFEPHTTKSVNKCEVCDGTGEV